MEPLQSCLVLLLPRVSGECYNERFTMRVYFDYNATTPLAPEVIEAVVARHARPCSATRRACTTSASRPRRLLDDARSAVAALINADPSEIVFTSGGTESDNFAIRGAADALEPTGRRHLIASAIEHEAVLNTLKALARRGWRTTLLPVDHTGIVSPDRAARGASPTTRRSSRSCTRTTRSAPFSRSPSWPRSRTSTAR